MFEEILAEQFQNGGEISMIKYEKSIKPKHIYFNDPCLCRIIVKPQKSKEGC